MRVLDEDDRWSGTCGPDEGMDEDVIHVDDLESLRKSSSRGEQLGAEENAKVEATEEAAEQE